MTKIDKNFITYLEEFVSENRKDKFQQVLSQRTRHFTVVLEDIFQPHNASAVVRSCDIFGIQDVHAIENKYKNKVSRHVAKGAQKWITLHRYREQQNNTQNCLDSLRDKGYQIIATTPHDESCLLPDFDLNKKSAFVFGVEKQGVSDYTLNNADGFLKIPMVGFTESLNVSVAVAIILQDITTKIKKTTIQWQLSDIEKEQLYLEWMQKSIKSIKKLTEHYYATN